MQREARRVLAAAAWCACLMTANYGLRPLRDALVVSDGLDDLPWLFSASFLAMLVAAPLYALAVARLGRARLVPIVHRSFALSFVLLFAAMQGWLGDAELLRSCTARVFFVWTSVFNLLVLSLFWSVMADLFSTHDARRLFGLISAGGSLGAIAGPALGGALSLCLDPSALLLLAALLLEASLWALPQLRAPVGERDDAHEQPIGGSPFAALGELLRSRSLLGICAYVLLLSAISTILYFMQAQLVADRFSDHAQRTAVFAGIDLAVNLLTIATQSLLTGRLIARFGLAWSLALVPMLCALGLALLAAVPVLAVVIAVQIVRMAGNHAISRPAREVLYTGVDRSQRYKAKSLIDTVIYRGGDTLGAWAFTGLAALGLGLGKIALLGVPLAASWALLGARLGRHRHAEAPRA